MAAPPSKRVFFGSLFEFSSAAVEEVRTRFAECLPPRSTVPFITYDRSNNVFSFICEQHDSVAVRTFAGNLKEYLDHQQNLQQHVEQDFVESPKIRAFDGTVIQEHLSLGDSVADKEGLVTVLGGDDSDSDEETVLETSKPDGMLSITDYWKPEAGSIEILTTSIAQEIAQLTGASLDPEPARQRVRVWGKNHEQALQKLKNLDHLLACLASQRNSQSSKASYNALLLRQEDLDVVIQFELIRPEHPSYYRLIVDESAAPLLEKKCIGELRKREVFNGPLLPLKNLRVDPNAVTRINEPKIWADFLFPKIGADTNMLPTLPSRTPTPEPEATALYNPDSSTAPGKFLSMNDSTKIQAIKAWSKDVTEPADPGLAPEPPAEDCPPRRRQRRPAADSDEEDGSKPEAQISTLAPSETTRVLDQLVKGGSESDRTDQGGAATRPSARARRLILDTDEEDRSEELLGETAVEFAPGVIGNASTLTKQTRGEVFETYDLPPPPLPDVHQRHGFDNLRAPAPSAGLSFEPGSPSSTPEALDIPVLNERHYGCGSQPQQFQCNRTQDEVAAVAPVRSQPPQLSALALPDDFDITRYGKPDRAIRTDANARAQFGQGGQPRGRETQLRVRGGLGTGSGASRSNLLPPVDSVTYQTPSNAPRGQSRHRGSRTQGRGHTQRSTILQVQGDNLIQVSTSSEPAGPPMPPPGMNIRIDPRQTESPFQPESINIIDHPLDNIQRPSLQPSSSNEDLSSVEYVVRSESNLSTNSAYATTSNPGINVGVRENEELARLLRMQKQEEEEAGARRQAESQSRSSRRPTQQQQTSDEFSTRRFHHTMGQRAPNLGRSKQGQKQETKKERQERIARALNDPLPAAKTATPSRKTEAKHEEGGIMSAKKRQALRKNPSVLQDFGPLPEEVTTSEQTENLLDALSPLFEACRAFAGQLRFEIRFGQVLIPDTEGRKQYDAKGWRAMFHPKHGQAPAVSSFTSVLTTNGADVDRMLETKALPQSGVTKLWDRSIPGPSTISFEFQCQSKENEEFWLLVSQDGSYQLRKGLSTIGMVNLHYPGQVWDACAVLQGSMRWSPSVEITSAAAVFVGTLYVPPGQKNAFITYRLPTTNEMTVRSLVMKRTSRHNCLSEGKQNFQLQITEVKSLYHRFNQKDTSLAQGFEKNYEQMRDEGRIHYEVSLVDTGINEHLSKNEELVLGELMDSATSGRALLEYRKVRDLLELTTYTVNKMDWVGAQNVGTLPRIHDEAARREQERLQSLGPAAASRMGGSRVPASRLGGGTKTERRVRGVRMNTEAELKQDDDGNFFYYGQGGARIPVPPADLILQGIDEEGEVAPDDSASVVAVKMQHAQQFHGLRRGPAPDRHGRQGGFW